MVNEDFNEYEGLDDQDQFDIPGSCTYCRQRPVLGLIHILDCDGCGITVCADCMDDNGWQYDWSSDDGGVAICPDCQQPTIGEDFDEYEGLSDEDTFNEVQPETLHYIPLKIGPYEFNVIDYQEEQETEIWVKTEDLNSKPTKRIFRRRNLNRLDLKGLQKLAKTIQPHIKENLYSEVDYSKLPSYETSNLMERLHDVIWELAANNHRRQQAQPLDEDFDEYEGLDDADTFGPEGVIGPCEKCNQIVTEDDDMYWQCENCDAVVHFSCAIPSQQDLKAYETEKTSILSSSWFYGPDSLNPGPMAEVMTASQGYSPNTSHYYDTQLCPQCVHTVANDQESPYHDGIVSLCEDFDEYEGLDDTDTFDDESDFGFSSEMVTYGPTQIGPYTFKINAHYYDDEPTIGSMDVYVDESNLDDISNEKTSKITKYFSSLKPRWKKQLNVERQYLKSILESIIFGILLGYEDSKINEDFDEYEGLDDTDTFEDDDNIEHTEPCDVCNSPIPIAAEPDPNWNYELSEIVNNMPDRANPGGHYPWWFCSNECIEQRYAELKQQEIDLTEDFDEYENLDDEDTFEEEDETEYCDTCGHAGTYPEFITYRCDMCRTTRHCPDCVRKLKLLAGPPGGHSLICPQCRESDAGRKFLTRYPQLQSPELQVAAATAHANGLLRHEDFDEYENLDDADTFAHITYDVSTDPACAGCGSEGGRFDEKCSGCGERYCLPCCRTQSPEFTYDEDDNLISCPSCIHWDDADPVASRWEAHHRSLGEDFDEYENLDDEDTFEGDTDGDNCEVCGNFVPFDVHMPGYVLGDGTDTIHDAYDTIIRLNHEIWPNDHEPHWFCGAECMRNKTEELKEIIRNRGFTEDFDEYENLDDEDTFKGDTGLCNLEIGKDFIALYSRWYDGQTDPLYNVISRAAAELSRHQSWVGSPPADDSEWPKDLLINGQEVDALLEVSREIIASPDTNDADKEIASVYSQQIQYNW